jgi:hypothetical protein
MTGRWARLYARISGTPWASWISHGVVVLAWSWATGEAYDIALIYTIREVVQLGLKKFYRQPVDYVDHVMDAAVPWVVAFLWVCTHSHG